MSREARLQESIQRRQYRYRNSREHGKRIGVLPRYLVGAEWKKRQMKGGE